MDLGIPIRRDPGCGRLWRFRAALMTGRRTTEERLHEIRRTAAQNQGRGGAASHPQIRGHDSYYGMPALKPPVWTWEVPLYFFIGGIAGVSSCIAFVAHIFQASPALIRLSLWMGLIGAAICPMLLIADLGRPSRFLNMLRVFKLRSPMSMGAWILVAFSGCAFLAVAAKELSLLGYASPLVSGIDWLGEASGALMGLLLASYTGVLIGATAIPVWFTHRRFLPAHFLTSGLGGASAILELSGFFVPATQVLGFFTAGLETIFEILFAIRKRDVDAPL
ncbi:MAG TPA: NrfD/PsrC family molybdoenzyme membrane anchor subunit, partial [Candidatus Acidoferrum sp.]|nr:NrfD/PsrC family molybdoenzyme membrane anchor subunit [Candidatus Acidoferrum sp.]